MPSRRLPLPKPPQRHDLEAFARLGPAAHAAWLKQQQQRKRRPSSFKFRSAGKQA
jgi:hypothetical protein